MPSSSIYVTLYSAIFLLSVNGLFAKGIPLDATSTTQVRSVIAAIALAIFLIATRRSLTTIDVKKLKVVYLIGILMGIHWVTYFHSMQISSIAVGMLAMFTFPIITVFLEAKVKRQRPHRTDLLLSLAVLAGIGIMAANETVSTESATLMGIFWGTLSAFCFAARNVIQKYYLQGISSDTLMLHQMIAISLLLVVFTDFSTLASFNAIEWGKLAILGVVTTAAAHTLLVKSYQSLPAKTVAMTSCLQPVVGAILAWMVLREQLSIYIVIGGSIILAVAIYESLKSKAG